jgi:hypothetical protein
METFLRPETEASLRGTAAAEKRPSRTSIGLPERPAESGYVIMMLCMLIMIPVLLGSF